MNNNTPNKRGINEFQRYLLTMQNNVETFHNNACKSAIDMALKVQYKNIKEWLIKELDIAYNDDIEERDLSLKEFEDKFSIY